MPRHASPALGAACWVLLALIAAHDLSHALDDGLDTGLGQLALVAVPQWVVLAGVMAVVLRGDRSRSAVAALLLGAGAVLGFAVVHLLPFALAPYDELSPSVASWLLAWLPTAAGAAVAALALAQLKRGTAAGGRPRGAGVARTTG